MRIVLSSSRALHFRAGAGLPPLRVRPGAPCKEPGLGSDPQTRPSAEAEGRGFSYHGVIASHRTGVCGRMISAPARGISPHCHFEPVCKLVRNLFPYQ